MEKVARGARSSKMENNRDQCESKHSLTSNGQVQLVREKRLGAFDDCQWGAPLTD